MSWITTQLEEESRNVFEKRYKRKLSNEELSNAIYGLTSFLEQIGKYEYEKRQKNGKQIQKKAQRLQSNS